KRPHDAEEKRAKQQWGEHPARTPRARTGASFLGGIDSHRRIPPLRSGKNPSALLPKSAQQVVRPTLGPEHLQYCMTDINHRYAGLSIGLVAWWLDCGEGRV